MLLFMLAVASVSPSGRASDAALITLLKRLARDVELVLLCDHSHAIGLVKRLRVALPLHNIISVLITIDADSPVQAEVTLIKELLNDGVLPVAVFPTGTAPPDLTSAMHRLARRFQADEMLTIDPKGVLVLPVDDSTGGRVSIDREPAGCNA
jgi:hypothetical protein